MSNATAMVIHHLLDEPENFKEHERGIITNGYYTVHLDASRYGMGNASYTLDGDHRKTMLNAVAAWKECTGWRPMEYDQEEVVEKPALSSDMVLRGYEEFSKKVRSHLRSHAVHSDATVFRVGLEEAVRVLDETIHPISRREKKQ